MSSGRGRSPSDSGQRELRLDGASRPRHRSRHGRRLADHRRVSDHHLVEQPDADAVHADLVARLFHPPRVVACGFEGAVDDDVTIVSHVELWAWRTVVRGSVTRVGSIAYNEGMPDASDPRGDVGSWLREWRLADDVGTEYRPAGAGRGGDGFCSDVHFSFRTAVPAGATRLTIVTPDGHRIEVPLGSNRQDGRIAWRLRSARRKRAPGDR
jgi:hypothetical protein